MKKEGVNVVTSCNSLPTKYLNFSPFNSYFPTENYINPLPFYNIIPETCHHSLVMNNFSENSNSPHNIAMVIGK